MRNFIKINHAINMDTVIDEIISNDALFMPMPIETLDHRNPGHPHRELRCITLRMTPFKDDICTNHQSADEAADELIAYDLDIYKLFPECRRAVYRVMEAVNASQIGRVCVARLDQGKRIYGHYDQGESARYYKRYHLMISGKKDNWITCGEGADTEHLEMLTGECWSFNHELWHSFANHSTEPRIYLNMDLR